MDYIVRVYFSDMITDIDLRGHETLSIGSSVKDNHVISDAAIKAKHICLLKSKGIWKIKCNGETYSGGKKIKSKEIEVNDTYILSRDKKIVVSVIPIQSDSGETLDITE